MGLKANNQPTGGGNRVEQPNIDPGSYPARVVSVIDLGVQPQKAFKGEAKPPAQMIRVTYELTDVFMLDEDGNEVEDKPRWISEDFKLYGLGADLAVSTKRYKTIDTTGQHDGDWSKLLGAGVMVAIVNNEGKNGKTYDNIGGTSIMRARDLDKLPELKNDPYFFDLSEPSPEYWKKIPQWLQDKIKANINFEGSLLQQMLSGVPAQADKKEVKNANKRAAVPADDPVDNDNDAGDDVNAGEEAAPW